jgi:excisionase family DNA binding protein
MSVSRDRFLRIGEVARRFGVTTDTIRTWVRQGRLRATRSKGGQRTFLEGDVEAAPAAHTSGPGRGSEAAPVVAPAKHPGGRYAPVSPARRPPYGLDLGIDPDPEVIIARDELEAAA